MDKYIINMINFWKNYLIMLSKDLVSILKTKNYTKMVISLTSKLLLQILLFAYFLVTFMLHLFRKLKTQTIIKNAG